jgi:opacity protein-like surface antigen
MEALKAKLSKHIFILISLLFITGSAKAWIRSTDSSLFVCGHGDILYTQLKNHLYGDDLIPGFGYGYGVEAYFSQWQEFGFTAGLQFGSRRFSKDDGIEIFNRLNESIGYTKARYKLNYLSLPVSARYNFGKRFNVYVDVGAMMNILLSANRAANPDSLPDEAYIPEHNYSFDSRDDHPGLTFSLRAGGGIEYFFTSRLAVYADYKYFLDLSSFYVYDNIAGGVDPKMYGHSLHIGLRYGIPIQYSVDERFQ